MTIKITSATFSACVTSKDGLPADQLPIIALVGRSNVGKSSLINALTGRKELARTSSMPGKTLTINFYCINDAFYIVDLPGYGYAKASKVTRAKIQSMMNDFFGECKNLKGVVQVIDIRHKASPLDIQMHEWLREQHFNGFAVLTKADKLSNQQAAKMKSAIGRDINGVYTSTFSSKNAIGRDEFLDAVEKIIEGFEFKIHESKADNRRNSPRVRPGMSEGKQNTPSEKNNQKAESKKKVFRKKQGRAGKSVGKGSFKQGSKPADTEKSPKA